MIKRQQKAAEKAPMALDQLALRVGGLAEEHWPQMAAAWMLKTQREALAACPPPATHMDPEQAGAYFNSLRIYIESRITAVVQSYSPAQWLWYLRRLPDLFEGDLATTGPYDQALMEVLSATSTKEAPQFPTEGECVAFPVTEGTVRRVLRLAAMAITLSEVHSKLRRAGKGTAYRVRHDAFPESLPDAGLENAIRLYDTRVAAHGQGLMTPGTHVLSRDIHPSGPAVMIAALPTKWQGLPTWRGTPQQADLMMTWGHFLPTVLSPHSLADILSRAEHHGPPWWSASLPSLIALQQALGWYLFHHTSYGWISLVRYGYVTLRWDLLLKMVDHTLPILRRDLDTWFPATLPHTADEVLAQVAALPVRLWPNQPGPVLRRAGIDVMVDAAAAARHLEYLCTIAPAGQGALVNARSRHFEEVVQALIDRSPWKPSPTAPVAGLKVKPYGAGVLTDLDAVGDMDGTLLLVSCKSHPYTALHDAGDYRTIRNTASLVRDAVAKWQKVLATLHAHPVGENYDLSHYQRILGVVCLSQVPYVPIGDATEVADTTAAGERLHMSCGFTELAAWLGVKPG